jgi:hypothetical protein
MPVANVPLYALNRGLMDVLGLTRVDLGRTALSAEEQTNFIPHSLGSMMLRPGFKHIGSSKSNSTAVTLPFIKSTEDLANIELTNLVMRVWVTDALVTRNSVGTAFTNGEFTSDVTGWVDVDDSGATSSWATGGYLSLKGTGFAAARRRQSLTIAGGDQGVAHGCRVVVFRGTAVIRIGSTVGNDNLFGETVLTVGTHSLVFTPTGASAFVELASYTKYASLIDSIAIEAGGSLELPAPWVEADLGRVRWEQSGDVLFLACPTYRQRRIERRDNNSWSLVLYDPEDGPFRNENIGPISLTPSAVSGDITLTASAALFRSTHVGALFRLSSAGQLVEATFNSDNQFSGHIRVVGVGVAQRRFTVTRSGITTATVTLQRSISEPGSWADVTTYGSNGTSTFDDGLDNQIAFYRLGIKSGGNPDTDTVDVSLNHSSGSISGVARVTAVASSTSASAIVLVDLGETDGTTLWSEGEWSDLRGYPTSVRIYEGRLWWMGKGKIWGSISDVYDGFDPDFEGDAGPLNRSVGFGPVDSISWLIGLQRLMAGAQGDELSIRSSSDNEPLTAENFNIKSPSNQGSADVAAVKIDSTLVFVQRSGTRVYELSYAFEPNDYTSRELTLHVPRLGRPSITRVAIQRQPDTRVHCVRSDGKVLLCLFNRAENLLCWVKVETDGHIEDVLVQPGDEEDSVYYLVRRTVNSVTVRYYEKWALESQCQPESFIYNEPNLSAVNLIEALPEEWVDGAVVTVRNAAGAKVENLTVTDRSVTLTTASTFAMITSAECRLADSFVTYSGVSTTSITGLGHLEGRTVVAWGDGKDLGTYTVVSGAITLTEAAEVVTVGLTYRARFKSSKLAYADGLGTGLSQVKTIDHIGPILAYTHPLGLQYGARFTQLYDLPAVKDFDLVQSASVHRVWDQRMFDFGNEFDTDSRLCLEANAPRPCTVLGIVIGIRSHDQA